LKADVGELNEKLEAYAKRFNEDLNRISEVASDASNKASAAVTASTIAQDTAVEGYNKAEEALEASAAIVARVEILEQKQKKTAAPRSDSKSFQTEVVLYQLKAEATSLAKKKLQLIQQQLQLIQQQFLAQKAEYEFLKVQLNDSLNRLSSGAKTIMANKENEENIHDELNSLV